MNDDIRARARKVRLLLLDVDGVLTDGGLYLGSGGQESKRFHVQDGMGVSLARRGGLKTGILTGRTSDCVARRGQELRMDEVVQGAPEKLPAFDAILERQGVGAEEVAYMGDDVQDWCVLGRVGLAMAPANARPEIRERVHLVTDCSGGNGAVREAVEFVLRAQGVWEKTVAEFLEEA